MFVVGERDASAFTVDVSCVFEVFERLRDPAGSDVVVMEFR